MKFENEASFTSLVHLIGARPHTRFMFPTSISFSNCSSPLRTMWRKYEKMSQWHMVDNRVLIWNWDRWYILYIPMDYIDHCYREKVRIVTIDGIMKCTAATILVPKHISDHKLVSLLAGKTWMKMLWYSLILIIIRRETAITIWNRGMRENDYVFSSHHLEIF